MDCFSWHIGLSDYLDKKLPSSQEQEMRGHLSSCTSCSIRMQHYQRILDRIQKDGTAHPQNAQILDLSSQTKSTKTKKKTRFELLRAWTQERIHTWKATPWYVKTSVEALAFTLVLVATFAVVPHLRQRYERGLDRQLEMMDVANLSTSEENIATTNDSDNEKEETDSSADESSPVQVGPSEIWRFNLKTDSPKQARPQVEDLLKRASAETYNTDVSGTEVPGGIQFDVLIPSSQVLSIKTALQEMSKKNFGKEVEQPFSWYKSKHKKPLSENNTRVVIWLPQV